MSDSEHAHRPAARLQVMTPAEVEHDRRLYSKLNTDPRFSLDRAHDFICTADKYASNAGRFDSSYFIQDIWGARKVAERRPTMHFDVGSSVTGFIAHLLCMHQPVTLIDIRPPPYRFDSPFLRQAGGASPILRAMAASWMPYCRAPAFPLYRRYAASSILA